MLLHVHQTGLSAWVTWLVAAFLIIGGIATLFTEQAFHWPVIAVGLVILGIQHQVRHAARHRRVPARSA